MKTEPDSQLPISVLRISIADMVAMRVRAAETGNPTPALLYQSFTRDAMGLIATLPRGTSAVSIGEQGGAFPILKSAAPPPDGFSITYARKPNNRYEAVEAIYQGQSFAISQFCSVARKLVEKEVGRCIPVQGRHAYLAPTREQWGVILRDGGYLALAPQKIVESISTEIIENRGSALNSGIIARVPIFIGTRSQGSLLPSFSRVEVTIEPNPNQARKWISFIDYQRMRSIQSRPPESMTLKFHHWLETLTRDCGFASWVFRPGMFFKDHVEWWGRQNRRRTLHEGIDFAEGLQHDNMGYAIPEKSPVRAMSDGEVMAILDDFLNKTVVLRHPDTQDEGGAFFCTLYSHIHPCIAQSQRMKEGQILGNVGKSRDAGAPAHLHVTGAWIPGSIFAGGISMDQIHPGFSPIVLINFNSLISRQSAVGSKTSFTAD